MGTAATDIPPQSLTVDDIPYLCLASIFQFLGAADRNRCSLVCRRVFTIEGHSRHRLSLNAESQLLFFIPSLFSRFDSVTELTLKCRSNEVTSIGDEALILISKLCPNLTRIEIRACSNLTDAGLEALAENCKGLKKFSCGSCFFGSKGMDALMHHCRVLEELSVEQFQGATDGVVAVSPLKLKAVSLTDTVFFYPFVGAKNLRILKLVRCSGDWDKLFRLSMNEVTSLVEVHLIKRGISDVCLMAISKCSNLEILHLVKTPKCSDAGIVAVAEGCKRLRKLRIGWESHKIGEKGLRAVGECCRNLEELVLIGMNPSKACLEMLASNCESLEQLGFCGSDRVGDAEMCSIATKCVALKYLYIEDCPVSDHGIKALAAGCPNLVRVKACKCKWVTDNEFMRYGQRSLCVTSEFQRLQIIPSPMISDPFKNLSRILKAYPRWGRFLW